MYKEHLDAWVSSCASMEIPITSKVALEYLKEVQEGKQIGEEEEHQQFTQEAFVDALTDFIVGDDLVSGRTSHDNHTIESH